MDLIIFYFSGSVLILFQFYAGFKRQKGGFFIKILIDADGCPVVCETIALAQNHHAECIILCDTSHTIHKDGAKTLTISKGADSVDFALVNLVSPGDIVVTQDYGLAAMCLARRAIIINQDGLEYTNQNIDALLSFRHVAKKIRNSGGRLKGPSKRRETQDKAFCQKLSELLLKGEKK